MIRDMIGRRAEIVWERGSFGTGRRIDYDTHAGFALLGIPLSLGQPVHMCGGGDMGNAFRYVLLNPEHGFRRLAIAQSWYALAFIFLIFAIIPLTMASAKVFWEI